MMLFLALYSFLTLPLFVTPATAVYRYMGCFQEPTAADGLLEQQPATPFQSVGLCKNRCGSAAWPIAALTNGTDCSCGSAMPPWDQLSTDDECDSRCPGYPMENCGGNGFFSVYLDQQIESREDALPAQSPAEPMATRAATSNAHALGALPLGGSGL